MHSTIAPYPSSGVVLTVIGVVPHCKVAGAGTETREALPCSPTSIVSAFEPNASNANDSFTGMFAVVPVGLCGDRTTVFCPSIASKYVVVVTEDDLATTGPGLYPASGTTLNDTPSALPVYSLPATIGSYEDVPVESFTV